MASILAVGSTAASSSDIVVAAGTPTTFFLTTADGSRAPDDVNVVIEMRSAAAQYMPVAGLNRNVPAVVIDGPGTYRVRRQVSNGAVGVDQD
jgi:hypothetical protein